MYCYFHELKPKHVFLLFGNRNNINVKYNLFNFNTYRKYEGTGPKDKKKLLIFVVNRLLDIKVKVESLVCMS